MEKENFAKFLVAVRAGDAQAAEELVRRYEPYLRRVIRLRLDDPRLRRVLDSVDVCQSILAVFFAEAAYGRFELQTPEQLGSLLTRMAINKLIAEARSNHRHQGGLPDEWDPADPRPSAEQRAADRDLLEAVRARLTPHERTLFEQSKVHGRTWEAIAQEMGESASALRLCLARARARVRRELGAGG
jgi:RNA polymerase sigma-70 factor (ECF subfamily)